MIAAGILAADEPVELLEGWLVPKMVKDPPHSTARHLTTKALERIVPSGWHVRSQEPITLNDSEPEPDVAAVRGGPSQYECSHPGPQDVALDVEIADVSLDRDRSIKKQVYARAGIPFYWIVNLQERRVEVYTDPSGPIARPDYGNHQHYVTGSEVPFVIEGHEAGHIPMAKLLRTSG